MLRPLILIHLFNGAPNLGWLLAVDLSNDIHLPGGKKMKKVTTFIENVKGRVAGPILMYIFGVPGFLCVLAWFFFFRGN